MNPDPQEHVVAGLYEGYSDTQKDIMEVEKRRTRNKLISLAILIFLMDLLGLAILNAVQPQTLLYIAVIPVIFTGLAFLALKEPMLAMIIAAIILLGAWTYTIVVTGARAAITGWLTKAIAIYLLIAGFQSAREVQRIKRELKL